MFISPAVLTKTRRDPIRIKSEQDGFPTELRLEHNYNTLNVKTNLRIRIFSTVPSKLPETVAILACIQNVPDSILGRDTKYPI
jgi:hypothetical protein